MVAALFALWFAGHVEQPTPLCFSSDVQQLCCPAACATKDSTKWSMANDVLRKCAKSIGCKDAEGWTVGMRCKCSPGKAR